jgi:hypothetical protein
MTHNKTRKNKKRVFSKKDYSSNDGMMTSIWGPSMWHSLHSISFNYPVNPTTKDKRNYRNFVLNLRYVLPCGKCRENLKENFKKLPLTMDKMASRDTFSRYVYELHEHINKMLGKKSGLSYDDVKERYEHFRARCTLDTVKRIIEKKTKKKEKGCVVPLHGVKSKCVLKVVPMDNKSDSIEINEKCLKSRS